MGAGLAVKMFGVVAAKLPEAVGYDPEMWSGQNMYLGQLVKRDRGHGMMFCMIGHIPGHKPNNA